MTVPYPLVWPEGMPRTAPGARVKSRFQTTLPKAIENVKTSLRLFGTEAGKPVADVVCSTNVAGILAGPPADAGVAVWFLWDGAQRCIAVDRYPSVAENLQAIHHVLEARRVELRHAGINMIRATFKGFLALPAPEREDWRTVLGLDGSATLADVRARHRDLVRETRDSEALSRINIARDRARSELGANQDG